MKIPFQNPDPSGSERAQLAREFRHLAANIARLRPQVLTRSNEDEAAEAPDPNTAQRHTYPASFTKGLAHDTDTGLLANPVDYHCFVEAINSPDRNVFDKRVRTAADATAPATPFLCTVGAATPAWRGWESPRSGHVYELEGPDAGAVGMPPAPGFGSSELAAEMAEVYALALLRDVPFTVIAAGGNTRIASLGGTSTLSAQEVVDALNTMPYFNAANPVSATPAQAGPGGLNRFEANRRAARTGDDAAAPLTTANAFRGSARGARIGPYVSQFLLAGNDALGGSTGGNPSFPGVKAQFDAEDGFIAFGSQIIDQRGATHKAGVDYMTDWASWLDVQNGADFQGANLFEDKRRFITTPRDLATYVHFDALYQAYLNAALILLAKKTPASRGFPEPSAGGQRTPFATFGGPHILSLVTEVATRCLKAVRRQKFNHHRRGRPEAIAGRLTAFATGTPAAASASVQTAMARMLDELPDALRNALLEHNLAQNASDVADQRLVQCPSDIFPNAVTGPEFEAANLLLPMAFPEGSPMHPAYGAGHATVAGGCVTMLKAFFEMFDANEAGGERILKLGQADYFEPNADGTRLVNRSGIKLSIQGELDKLAANIGIGRNMAGVHFYSDYYDSMRLGERIAVGILMEQAPTYGDEMSVSFDSFDGDRIELAGEAGTCPTLMVSDRHGNAVMAREWWLRHAAGEDVTVDPQA